MAPLSLGAGGRAYRHVGQQLVKCRTFGFYTFPPNIVD